MAEIGDHAVILGAGHAGGIAAAQLRQSGFMGRITVVGEEDYPPYERPPLSKELLAGKMPVEKTFLRPQAWYEEQSITLRLSTRVAAIEAAAQRLRLDDGETIAFDQLLIATGAAARRLSLPGAELETARLVYIRTIADSLALRERLARAQRVVIIGAGFIGLEVAAVARGMGRHVTVLEVAPQPMQRVVAPEIGSFYIDLHRRHGVDMHMGVRVTGIEDGGDAAHVLTADGTIHPADVVVAGVGAAPATVLAEAAGLEVEDGIIVDAHGRTSGPGIFAAGDAARFFSPLLDRRIRHESWHNAQNQAAAVAKVMAGGTEPYSEVPWFWTDQYDVNLQVAGAPAAWDRLVFRGSPADPSFAVFYLRDGMVVGGATVNAARDMRFMREMVRRGVRADPDKLADRAVKLMELARA